MIAAFRKLEECEAGRYVEGRHGWPSRFVWGVGSLSACLAIQGESSEVEALDVESDEESAEECDVLEHTFNLRTEYQVEITLPLGLTENEAERLAGFIRSLPMDDFQ